MCIENGCSLFWHGRLLIDDKNSSNSLFYQTIFCSFVYLTKNCLRKVLDFILSKLDRRPISCYFRVIASFEGSWDGCSSQVGSKKSKYLADVPNKSKVIPKFCMLYQILKAVFFDELSLQFKNLFGLQ